MEARFCGNCGNVLPQPVAGAPAVAQPPAPAPPPPAAPATAPVSPQRTVFGIPEYNMPLGAPSGGAPAASPAPTAPAAPTDAMIAATVPEMPMMPVPAAHPQPAAPAFAPPAFAPPAIAPPVASPAMPPGAPAKPMPVATAHKTMLGMAMDFANAPPGAMPAAPAQPAGPPGAPAGAPPSGAGPAAVRSAHKTMLGVALSPPGAGAPPPGAMPGVVAPPQQPGPGGGAGPMPVANANRTMLGMQFGEMPGAVPGAMPGAMPGAVDAGPARGRHETPPMIGGAAPGMPPDTMPPTYGMRPPGADAYNPAAGVYPSDGGAAQRPARSRAPIIAALVALAALLAAAAIAVYVFFSRGPATEPPLQAEVHAAEGGALSMTVTLPNMPPGTVVRHNNAQQPLDARGSARLPLTISPDQVGRIDVPIEVVAPNAAPQRRTARVVLAYRVQPDLSGLALERPRLRLLFRVEPGARLVVNNQPVQTNPQTGEGAATIDNVAPMPVDGPDTLRSPFNVQVTASDGTVATGVYDLRVPRTPLAVDRPASASLITAAERVVVRGRAPRATRVTVNNTAARVEGDAFAVVMPLPGAGRQSWNVVAYSGSGAPALSRLEVERAAPSDRAAPTRFLNGSRAGAAEVARNALTIGTRVRLRGRVLAAPIEHDAGQAFQLVVTERPCEPGRCVVWVDTEPGAAPQANATVEVIGVASGRRSSTTSSGPRNDPVVHAAFVM